MLAANTLEIVDVGHGTLVAFATFPAPEGFIRPVISAAAASRSRGGVGGVTMAGMALGTVLAR